MATSLASLPTPCALVDLDRVEANTARMAEHVRNLGARLRPHVKTHKCPPAGRLQVAGHFGGITVSTLAEAHTFARAGFTDITWALPLPHSRITEMADLALTIDCLSVLVDGPATLAELEQAAQARHQKFSVFLKVDCGNHRAGVDPFRDDSLTFGRQLASSPAIDFRGVLAHAGHAYACSNREEVHAVAEQEREVTVTFAERLRATGIAVPEISVGSTPTLCVGENLTGVTEARPGNYVFFDVFQVAIGSCEVDNIAFSVLCTVVGRYPERNALVIDAGALALSKDAAPQRLDPNAGYGILVSEDGTRIHPRLRLRALHQEHGVIEATGGLAGEFPVGSRLRVLPNHSCLAAALFDRYHVHRGGEIVDEWIPVRGW